MKEAYGEFESRREGLPDFWGELRAEDLGGAVKETEAERWVVPTSILSSLSLSNLTCLNVDADAEPAVNGAPMVAPLYAIAAASSTSATEVGFFWLGRGGAKWVEVFGVFVYIGVWLVSVLFSN